MRAIARIYSGKRKARQNRLTTDAPRGCPTGSVLLTVLGNRRIVAPVARARIAAHVGDIRRSVSLIEAAMAQGWPYAWEGLGRTASDPLLVPLHSDPEFLMLTRPSSDDTP